MTNIVCKNFIKVISKSWIIGFTEIKVVLSILN